MIVINFTVVAVFKSYKEILKTHEKNVKTLRIRYWIIDVISQADYPESRKRFGRPIADCKTKF